MLVLLSKRIEAQDYYEPLASCYQPRVAGVRYWHVVQLPNHRWVDAERNNLR